MSEAFDVVVPRVPEGLAVYFQPRDSRHLYRVSPMRDPEQPRLWCLLVYRCTRGGAVDPTERPWMAARGIDRGALPATLDAIRADVAAWLAHDTRRELHRWLIDAAAEPPVLTGRQARAAAPVAIVAEAAETPAAKPSLAHPRRVPKASRPDRSGLLELEVPPARLRQEVWDAQEASLPPAGAAGAEPRRADG